MSNYNTVLSTNFLILFICYILFTSSANAIPRPLLRKVKSQNLECDGLYYSLGYNLWKHLCGTQTAGKRSQVTRQIKVDYSQRRGDAALRKELSQEESRFLNTLLKKWKREKRDISSRT